MDICPKTHGNPKYNILRCTLTIQFFDYNNYNHCDNHNLNRTTRSSFFTAQPVGQRTNRKQDINLNLKTKTRIEIKPEITLRT